MPWTAAFGLGIVAGYVELIAGNGPYAELIASQRGGLVRL